MRFRPCIDLRGGRVVQIVGGTLTDHPDEGPTTNFETQRSPADFAELYKKDNLPGGHIISLGPNNREAALSALSAFPGGFHMGGGITPENAGDYLDAGASHVIVTSYVFSNGRIDWDRLKALVSAVGRKRLVLDLSCRKKETDFIIVTDRWQKFTTVAVSAETLDQLAGYCDEFLVHGVDVEGKKAGIQNDLVTLLGQHSSLPVTYAGGVQALSDLDLVKELGKGRVDITVGSALDILAVILPIVMSSNGIRRTLSRRVVSNFPLTSNLRSVPSSIPFRVLFKQAAGLATPNFGRESLMKGISPKQIVVIFVLAIICLAGTVPGEETKTGVLPEFTEVLTPMRDAVKLAANVFFPEGRGPWPVILTRTPYLKDTERWPKASMRYTGAGYVYMVQDSRGKGHSEGFYIAFKEDIQMGTIRWNGLQSRSGVTVMWALPGGLPWGLPVTSRPLPIPRT